MEISQAEPALYPSVWAILRPSVKRILLLLVFALCGCLAPDEVLPPEDLFAEVRFVDDALGSDANDGTTPERAWQTLARVNAFTPRTSTRISFKRGGTWRGALQVHGGTKLGFVAYGAFGEGGPKPLLLGSIDASDGWTDPDADSIWERAWEEDPKLPTRDVVQGPGNLWFVDEAGAVTRWGFRKQTAAQLSAEGDFFYEPTAQKLQLRSALRPTGRIEAGLNRTQLPFAGQSYLMVEDLAFRFGGGYALQGHEVKHVRFRRLDVSWSGGGTKRGEYVRLGNGVEFVGNVDDALVEDCRFFQLYDTGVDCQNTGASRFHQQHVVFRRNVISRMGLASYELWGRGGAGSRFDDIRFEHNTCLFAGSGWAYEQHDHPGQGQLGGDVVVFENHAAASALVVRDNLFVQPKVGFFAEYQPTKPATRALVDVLSLDFNLYSSPVTHLALLYDGDDPLLLPTSKKFDSLDAWRSFGREAHGLEGDPGFVSLGTGDPFHDDLSLSTGSVARGASSDGGNIGAH